MLHEGHTGIVRMESFAHGYVWWPNMDHELKQCVRSCSVCQVQRKSPPVAPSHPWAWPDRPWSRIHIDYAGPIEGKMFLAFQMVRCAHDQLYYYFSYPRIVKEIVCYFGLARCSGFR